jgi:hypothetical protein
VLLLLLFSLEEAAAAAAAAAAGSPVISLLLSFFVSCWSQLLLHSLGLCVSVCVVCTSMFLRTFFSFPVPHAHLRDS